MDTKVKAAIAAIPDAFWTPIRYPRAVWDDQAGRWVCDAEVTETEYTAFTSKKGKAITARLIVRRVKDLGRKAAPGQGELFCAWRYHAIFTDSPFTTLQAEEQHRGHAQVKQVFADLTNGPMAHLPSGCFPANAAWLACAAISHNLLRAAGALASRTCAKARAATLRRDLIGVAAPDRPPRPRPPHRAPARRLAPCGRMDERVRSRLRPARRHGLTSPDRSPHPHGPAATARHPSHDQENPGKPQNGPAAEKPRRKTRRDLLAVAGDRLRVCRIRLACLPFGLIAHQRQPGVADQDDPGRHRRGERVAKVTGDQEQLLAFFEAETKVAV